MKKRTIIAVSWCILCIMMLSWTATAQGTEALAQETISQPSEDFDVVMPGEEGATVMSIANPVKAYLAVNTYCYLSPDPSNGHCLGVIAENTNVWVVEKAWCAADGFYYYYCGFTYNNASHRGYFHENNVYRNGSKYLPANIDDESKPANMKEQISLAGTVYAGPAETYATVGSVGQESIKLIRTEGDYNFIEYTVTSTGKLKRGFLHYSKITGSWADRTARNASLDGKTFYIRYTPNQQYWGTYNGNGANTRIQLQSFTGNTNQIFKFVYDSEHKFFYIQPAVAYDVNRRLAVRWVSDTEHADRWCFLKDSAVILRQQFWVIKINGYSDRYKIVPRSSYGTMTLASRSGFVNQYYTSASTSSNDVWTLEPTSKHLDINFYHQDESNWCWVASAKMAASAENATNLTTQSNAVYAIKQAIVNNTGTIMETRQAANYFMRGNINDTYFAERENQIYSEGIARRFIQENHAIILNMQRTSSSGTGHAIVLKGFAWIDAQNMPASPGFYYYYCLDPLDYLANDRTVELNKLIDGSYEMYSTNYRWQHTITYTTTYSGQTISS